MRCYLAQFANLPLTPQQETVVACFLRGLSLKETAYELGISQKTASDHKVGAMRRLGVKSDVDLVLAMIRRGRVAGFAAVDSTN